MKPTLQLKIGQHLTMTPQLQQAIRLLQLSSLDLQSEVQEALESNPLLEEDVAQEESAKNKDGSEATDFSASETKDSSETTDTKATEKDVDLEKTEMPDDLPVDSAWDDVYQGTAGTGSSSAAPDDDSTYERQGTTESLYDHLHWQLNLTPFSDLDRAIAFAIIEATDNNGYVRQSLEEIQQAVMGASESIADLGLDTSRDEEASSEETLTNNDLLTANTDLSEDDFDTVDLYEIEAVLHRLQHFDPPGVCCRDLRECLLIQLKQLPDDTEHLNDALCLVGEYMDLLGNRDYAKIMRKTKFSEARLTQALKLVQTLNPHPGAGISTSDTEYVIPDIIVTKKENRWVVELNPDSAPRLRINNNYASLLQNNAQSNDNSYLKNHLQEAKWFIKSLQSRNETLLKVATHIVEEQRKFLDYGPEAMKPLVLHDIAEAVEMHESTISRVTTQKFIHTPQGIFELKYFFSSHVSTSNGGECSSTAIRAIIKKLVAAENPKKPLSDSKIAAMLEEQGIQVARRTIAKYRETLHIPPSNERKRLI